MNNQTWLWPSLIALSAATSPVCAAEPVEEVIVRAGFKEAQLFKSTGSISVVDAQQVSERGAQHLEDTLNALPNVSFSSGGSRARFVQIRGVGELEQFVDPKHFPSVGIIVDGVELSGVATGALLMDVDQVELLRGPQGTRFGASALAGIINISSNDPGDQLDGELGGGIGNYDAWHITTAVGGPLTDGLQGRLAFRQYQSDGFIDNRYLNRDDTNDRDELAARGKLRWCNDYGLQIDLTGLYLDIDNGYDAFSLDNQRNTLADQPGEDTQEAYALAGNMSWEIAPELVLEGLLTWTDSDETYGFDEDWVFAGFCDGIRCDPASEYSSTDTLLRDRQQGVFDLRLLGERNALGWVAGVFQEPV
jgi:iron complex outermembrane receptor protein